MKGLKYILFGLTLVIIGAVIYLNNYIGEFGEFLILSSFGSGIGFGIAGLLKKD